MILRNARYSELAERIKRRENRIIVYGAGMIGQIVVPDMIARYCLYGYLDCYIDQDKRKQGETIKCGTYQYEVKSPEILEETEDDFVLLITNSNFYRVIEYLDRIPALNGVEGYIIPMMQIYELQFADRIRIRKLNGVQKIPKKIHYCWFGGKKMPEFLQECISSWKELCPDYEIVCWDETNYDVSRIPYMKEAFEQKKYGFVTDVARLDILYRYGGIYMDTDVTLLKRPDDLLYQEAFVGVEKWGNINTGGCCGAVAYHPVIEEMLSYRKKFHFVREDGSLNLETNGIYETMPFIQAGMRVDNTMQMVKGMTVYPSGVFHPYDYMSCEEQRESYTVSVHHFRGGWMEECELENRKDTQKRYREITARMEDAEEISKGWERKYG